MILTTVPFFNHVPKGLNSCYTQNNVLFREFQLLWYVMNWSITDIDFISLETWEYAGSYTKDPFLASSLALCLLACIFWNTLSFGVDGSKVKPIEVWGKEGPTVWMGLMPSNRSCLRVLRLPTHDEIDKWALIPEREIQVQERNTNISLNYIIIQKRSLVNMIKNEKHE